MHQMRGQEEAKDDNSSQKPKTQGILKKESSIGKRAPVDKPATNWDEMNIMATYHPADKTYGHQKINEPPTPFERTMTDVDENSHSNPKRQAVNPEDLASRLNSIGLKESEKAKSVKPSLMPEDEESVGAKEKYNAFKEKRRKHYDEFLLAKMAANKNGYEEEEEDK